jgi:AraC family transcriptional regulator of adaptative response/methylated-DNA-[protein]-cysteine methyltransferase
MHRDNQADGRFFYSVSTTGVYCRPSCGAKRPDPANVQFHSNCEAAEKAGFRPCKRCRPNEPSIRERHTAAIAEACRFIENADEMPRLSDVAARAGISSYHFHRLFKAVTGLTPKSYAAAIRGKRVREELKSGATVTDAIYASGYNSNARFYDVSSSLLGMKPSDFRKGGTGIDIRFAIGQCSLGAILVAQSELGICAILLGDDPAELLRELESQLPGANLLGGDAGFEQLIARVIAFVEAPATGLDLPLDVRGTAFQQLVWQALRDIPAGSTATYTSIAEKIGSPGAVRAVASACAANRLAIAIPCHRVVRLDGGLAGYRWGVERKRELLRRER